MRMHLPEWSSVARALARPRNRVLLGVALLLLAVRAALPHVIRPILVSQADAALAGRIALADLDLSLIRGGVTLRGLEVYASELPSQAGAASAPDPALPVFDAQRLWVQISWFSLLAKTLRIEELEIEDFRVRLERTAHGLTLPGPAPSAAESEPAPEASEADSGPGWSLAQDAVSLRGGAISFIDQTTRPEPRRFNVALQDLSGENLEFTVGPRSSSKEPGRVSVHAQVGEGSIDLDTRVEARAAGPALTSTITLSSLPLAGVHAYLPRFGYSDLQARLDAQLVHRFETGGPHELSGQLSFADLAVRVPDLARPALAWQKLEIALDKIDFVAQDARVAQIVLTGAQLPIDPRGPEPLRVFMPPSDPNSAAAPEEPAKPWTWHLGKVQLAGSTVELLGAGEPLPLAVDLEVRDLDSGPATRWPLHLALATGAGKLDVDGELAIAPLAFEGSLALADFPLPPLLARLPAPGAELLRAGAARADLRIALAQRAASSDAAPTDLRVSGVLGFSGFDVGEPAPAAREFGASWKDFEIGIRELALADVLAPGGPRKISLGLEKLRLAEPSFTVTRSAEGIVLPTLAAADPQAEPAPPVEPTAPEPSAPAPSIVVDVSNLRIEAARARILDRSVTPAYRAQLDRIDVSASGIRWPDTRADRLVIALRGLAGAKLDVRGSLNTRDTTLTAKLSQLELPQFSPYIAASGYSLSGGSLAFDSQARFAPSGYDSSTGLVVSRLDIGGAQGASRFQENFGIPLSLGLSLLKDMNGDITLTVPIAGDGDETRVALGDIVLQALRKALVGALASPLKVLGGVVSSDGKVQAFAPEPIPFPDGSAELGPDGAGRVAELAELLGTSPGVALTLAGVTSEADARILRERAILAELRAATGVRALAALGEIGTRNAVRAHLEGLHAGGPPADLDAEQRAWLDARVAAQPLDGPALDALASERVTAARLALSATPGVAPDRLALASPAAQPVAQAGVAVTLGTPQVAAP